MADDTPGPAASSQGPAGSPPPPPKPKPKLWPWIVSGLSIALLVGVTLWIVLAPHRLQRTNDAYVAVHIATVAPRIAGQVAAVLVGDNQPVRAGQLVLRLDDRDQRAAVEQAQAALASDEARVAEAQAQLARQPALIDQARAQAASVSAHLQLSATDARRFANLARTGAGTQQQSQQSLTSRRQDEAQLAGARADVRAQTRQLDALRATVAAASARVAADAAQLAQARLNLAYTRLTAPLDGVVDQRQTQVGDYVAVGAPVMTVVPLGGVYVLANFRELALRHMRPGQHARIHLDAYDVDLDGVVDSLPPATGASYSPIPPNNATGNFTKIVQRLPVKIVFAPGQRLALLARVGMSTEVAVDTGLEDVAGEQRTHDARVTGWR